MALRDQPYIPLYVQDFQTDEKLMECSAAATGVYIRLMCIMHKSDPYGVILLRQKDKQNSDQILNFATKVAKSLPYPLPIIQAGITELLNENVLQIDGDKLLQKRMVKDGEISVKRSKSGKIGGDSTKKRINNFAQANIQANVVANSENENEYEYENELTKRDMGEQKIYGDPMEDMCYNIEEFLEKHQKQYEVLVMNSPVKDQTIVKAVIKKYHLTMIEQGGYPKKPLQFIAGITKWLYNEKKFSANGQHNATSVGKTLEFD